MKTFKQILDCPNFEISKDGIIRNIKTKYIKSQYLNDSGYYMVTFSINNKSKPRRVHRLLAKAYIPNPKGLKCINHKNAIKTDNSIENLEWCTQQYNIKHAISMGIMNNVGENNGQSKLKTKEVISIKKLLKQGLSQYKISKMFGVSRSTILGIKLGRLWKHIKV